ncbi:hypothetical protein O181_078321, partial [Austropuccinia psidii MF-1]|nr:hypothetical protein [Austropuccinia psidii MF-1]
MTCASMESLILIPANLRCIRDIRETLFPALLPVILYSRLIIPRLDKASHRLHAKASP